MGVFHKSVGLGFEILSKGIWAVTLKQRYYLGVSLNEIREQRKGNRGLFRVSAFRCLDILFNDADAQLVVKLI